MNSVEALRYSMSHHGRWIDALLRLSPGDTSKIDGVLRQ
jgi:hypothetical protein